MPIMNNCNNLSRFSFLCNIINCSDSESISDVFSLKCRVMMSKKIIPEIETAYFEGRGGQNYSIPVFDYGEAYCLEVPFVVLFETGKYKMDKIVILKK